MIKKNPFYFVKWIIFYAPEGQSENNGVGSHLSYGTWIFYNVFCGPICYYWFTRDYSNLHRPYPTHEQTDKAKICFAFNSGVCLCYFIVYYFWKNSFRFIGNSMPAFRIAGGILLFLTALEMLFQRRAKRRQNQSKHELIDDPSVSH